MACAMCCEPAVNRERLSLTVNVRDWRQLPKDFPPRSTVYNYFWEWTRYGVLDRIHHELLVRCREAAGREASPTAAIIDTQVAKATEKGGSARIRLAMMPARKPKASSVTRSSTR